MSFTVMKNISDQCILELKFQKKNYKLTVKNNKLHSRSEGIAMLKLKHRT